MRYEFFYAQSQLDSLRAVIIQFDDYYQNAPTTGASHFEDRGSRPCVDALLSSYTSSQPELLLKALLNLLRQYHRQIIQLHKTFNLQRDLTSDLGWINTIANLCTEQLEEGQRKRQDRNR